MKSEMYAHNVDSEPARIFMFMHRRFAEMGQDVQLFCRSSGSPQPTVTWLDTNEQEIRPDNKNYKVRYNFSIHAALCLGTVRPIVYVPVCISYSPERDEMFHSFCQFPHKTLRLVLNEHARHFFPNRFYHNVTMAYRP